MKYSFSNDVKIAVNLLRTSRFLEVFISPDKDGINATN